MQGGFGRPAFFVLAPVQRLGRETHRSRPRRRPRPRESLLVASWAGIWIYVLCPYCTHLAGWRGFQGDFIRRLTQSFSSIRVNLAGGCNKTPDFLSRRD
jgi:hypothetical protein